MRIFGEMFECVDSQPRNKRFVSSVGLILCALLVLSECRSSPTNLETPVDYTGYKVIRAHPVTSRQKKIFHVYFDEDKHRGVTLWTEPLRPDHSIDLLVAKDAVSRFLSKLGRENVFYEVLVEDLQRLIDEQKREEEEQKRNRDQNRRRRRSPHTDHKNGSNNRFNSDDNEEEIDLTDITNHYANYTEISEWLRLVEIAYPNITKVIVIGTSYHRRPLLAIKIGEQRNVTKPAIWIDGGIHAREWISPATAIYIINELLKGYDKDAVIMKMIAEFDWFILPVVNPDGYEFSHSTDRLWRKTRSRILTTSRRNCVGVDANRNFDFRWQSECEGNFRCRGRMPCSEVFAGHRAFSEPETIALANTILRHKDSIKMYFSFHSYSQLWLLPWGYTRQHPNDYEDLRRLSQKAVEALKIPYNTTYSIGTPAELLYPATGGSYDWAKGVAGIKYSFTMELRDTGNYGFLLPYHQIQPTGRETWAAIVKSIHELKRDTCWMRGTKC